MLEGEIFVNQAKKSMEFPNTILDDLNARTLHLIWANCMKRIILAYYFLDIKSFFLC